MPEKTNWFFTHFWQHCKRISWQFLWKHYDELLNLINFEKMIKFGKEMTTFFFTVYDNIHFFWIRKRNSINSSKVSSWIFFMENWISPKKNSIMFISLRNRRNWTKLPWKLLNIQNLIQLLSKIDPYSLSLIFFFHFLTFSRNFERVFSRRAQKNRLV